MKGKNSTHISMLAALLLVLATVLAACDSGSPAPTPTPIQPPAAQATQAPANPTAEEQPTSASAEPTAAAEQQAQPTEQATAGAAGAANTAAIYQAAADAFSKNDYDTAITYLTQVIEAVPDFEPAYILRAKSYSSKGDADSAIQDLSQAASVNPEDPGPLLLTGGILAQKGQFDQALDALNYAVQLGPSDPNAYYVRAGVYLAKKDTASALDDLQQVVKLTPDSDMGKQAAAYITQLGGQGGDQGSTQPPALPTTEPSSPEVPPSDQALPEAPPTDTPVAGQMVADLGFRPEKDGFSFENYGFDPNRTDLTADDMRRMFGDQVCKSVANGCILTPAAQAKMDQWNKDLAGGHCEGFAALSLVFYENLEQANKFGAPSTHDLKIDGNTALQREIAYYWTTQVVDPTYSSQIHSTPSGILDTLINDFKNGASAPDAYTLAIFKPGFKDGHAVTPYAVKDLGGGKYAIMVYDNNHVNDERAVIVDRNANTWQYNAALNPSVPEAPYAGDATTDTMYLTPIKQRLNKQTCDFCLPSGTGRAGNSAGAPATQYNEVSLDGTGHLLITDSAGHRTGFLDDNHFVTEIQGVQVLPVVSSNLWKDSSEPVYRVPTGMEFSLTVESSDPQTNTISTVNMVGPGYVLSVQDIVLEPNSSDTISFSSDGKSLEYKTQYSDSPDILLGTDGPDAAYAFLVKGVDLGNDGSVKVSLDTDNGSLVLDTNGNQDAATYGVAMDRITDAGEQVFGHEGITLQPNDVAYLDYSQWKGNGDPLQVQIDHNSDGTIDETVDLTDQQ